MSQLTHANAALETWVLCFLMSQTGKIALALNVILSGAIDDKRHEPFKTNEFVIMYSPFGTVQQSGRSYPHNIYNIWHTRKLITGKLIMVSTDCMLF